MKDINHQQKDIEQFYDEYVQRQLKHGVNKRHHSILNKLKEAGLKNNHKVLEVGCGIGTFTGLLIKEVVHGKVVAMDISGASVKYASDNNPYKNLKFVHADAANHDFGNQKFDVVVLPDVLEHIPIELHRQLFKKLSDVLNDGGFIFIHIPNPYYLKWCHENRPDLLQVIDQPITTDILVENTNCNNLYIDRLKTYSIWVTHGDYQVIVLRKNGWQDFKQNEEKKVNLISKIKYKLNALRK